MTLFVDDLRASYADTAGRGAVRGIGKCFARGIIRFRSATGVERKEQAQAEVEQGRFMAGVVLASTEIAAAID